MIIDFFVFGRSDERGENEIYDPHQVINCRVMSFKKVHRRANASRSTVGDEKAQKRQTGDPFALIVYR